MVKFLCGEESEGALRWRKVIPYGLLFGPRFYVVARVKSKAEPFLFRLDRMHDLEVTNEAGAPPESFDLEAYASRSFGVFQEEAEDIVLRFDPSAAPDARGYLFYPTQPWSPRRMDRSRFVSAQRAFANRPSPHNLGSTLSAILPARSLRIPGNSGGPRQRQIRLTTGLASASMVRAARRYARTRN